MAKEGILGIVLTLIELVLTTIVGFCIKNGLTKQQKKREDYARLRDEEIKNNFITLFQNEDRTVADSINQNINILQEHVKREIVIIKDDISLVKIGLQKNLYVNLCNLAEKLIHKKFATRVEKQDFESIYTAYHNLGANGIADQMREDVMNLPDSL